jgi:hypothetical protein
MNNMIMQQLFTLYKSFRSGGKIKVMKGYKKKTDHKDLFAIARYFAEKGETIQITTDIHLRTKNTIIYLENWKEQYTSTNVLI